MMTDIHYILYRWCLRNTGMQYYIRTDTEEWNIRPYVMSHCCPAVEDSYKYVAKYTKTLPSL